MHLNYLFLQAIGSDTAILHKINDIATGVGKLQDKPDALVTGIIITLVTALVTSICTYFVQIKMLKSKNEKEHKKELSETFHKSERNLYQLKALFIKLASLRNLIEFYYCYSLIADREIPPDRDDTLVALYRDYSNNYSKEAINCDLEIKEKISDYHTNINKFCEKANYPLDSKKLDKKFDQIDFKQAVEIISSNYTTCRTEYKANKEQLINDYLALLTPFMDENEIYRNLLQTELNKK